MESASQTLAEINLLSTVPAISRGPGQPAHAPTEKTRTEVAVLAGFGIQQPEIASYLQIEAKALRRHYRQELDVGVTRANAAIAGRLYKAAMVEGSVAAMIFWLKARAGWSEKYKVDIVVQTPTVFDAEDANA